MRPNWPSHWCYGWNFKLRYAKTKKPGRDYSMWQKCKFYLLWNLIQVGTHSTLDHYDFLNLPHSLGHRYSASYLWACTCPAAWNLPAQRLALWNQPRRRASPRNYSSPVQCHSLGLDSLESEEIFLRNTPGGRMKGDQLSGGVSDFLKGYEV